MPDKLKLVSKNDRKKIISYLVQGKIGLFPTDTVYGICCRLDNSDSVRRIFEIKGREKDKPLLILSDSLETAKKYIKLELSVNKKRILEKYWPGALTVVFKAKKENVNELVRAGGGTVAVRIPDNNELREIIEKLNVPIVAPSANPSGEKTPYLYSQIDKGIIEAVDFIVEGECKMKSASTILDFSTEKVKILREGALKINI